MTAAGERERELRSRASNLAEALGVTALALGGVWAGPALGLSPRIAHALGSLALAMCGGFALLVSPRLHGDGRAARGLPERISVRRAWRALGGTGRGARRSTVAVGAVAVALTLVPGWPYLLARLGVRRHLHPLYDWLSTRPEGIALGVVTMALVLGVGGLALVRWESWAAAWRSLALPALVLAGVVVLLGALVAPGPRHGGPLERAPLLVAWGFVQQWVFLGWLNTRLRRAIPPRGGSRAGAALATGLVFGVAHAPSVPLALVTGAGGTWLGWVFQRDRTRNLVASGIAHGALAVVYAWWGPGSMAVGPP